MCSAARSSRQRFLCPRCSAIDHAAFRLKGRATYSMEFKHYSEAPKNVAEAVTKASWLICNPMATDRSGRFEQKLRKQNHGKGESLSVRSRT